MSYATVRSGSRRVAFGLVGLGAFGTQPTIKQGSSGDVVKLWQGFLGITADGAFGSGTTTATKAFQLANGLTADGVVGAKSWAKADEVQAARVAAAPAGAMTTVQIPGMPPLAVPSGALTPQPGSPVPQTAAPVPQVGPSAPPAPSSPGAPSQAAPGASPMAKLSGWWNGQTQGMKVGIVVGSVAAVLGLSMLFGSSPKPYSPPRALSSSTTTATPNGRRRRKRARKTSRRVHKEARGGIKRRTSRKHRYGMHPTTRGSGQMSNVIRLRAGKKWKGEPKRDRMRVFREAVRKGRTLKYALRVSGLRVKGGVVAHLKRKKIAGAHRPKRRKVSKLASWKKQLTRWGKHYGRRRA